MRWLMGGMRVAFFLALGVCVATGVNAGGDDKSKEKAKGETAKSAKRDAASPAKAEANASATPASAASAKPARAPAASAARVPQGSRGAGVDERTESEYVRIPSTVGGLGLFTQESGETMPFGSFSFAGYADKFSRMPGHTTVLNMGWNLAVGFHDRFNFVFQWDPHRYLKVQRPNQTSFNSPVGFPQFGNTIYRSLLPLAGTAPGYVEDFPFANRNAGGAGDIRLGLRFGVAQQRLSNPINLTIGYDFFIPTQTQLGSLLDNQVQLGTFSHGPRVSASRTWTDWLMSTLDFSHRFTRDHRFGNPTPAFRMADQTRIGIGFLLFPKSRWQVMNEYNALIFNREATPNTTFGARDPMEGIWGMRLYFTQINNLALDAGYRYSLNLKGHGDRNGFVIKLAATHWGAPPAPKITPNNNPSASCSADKSGTVAGSGESVRVMMRATDSDGDPLSYSWSASGGAVSGSGAEATWNPGNAGPGMYTITGNVNDGRGGTATCSVDVRVDPRPNRPPTLTCSAERSSVLAGERVRVTGQASDPDGDNLTYSWQANAGQVVGSGSSVQWDSSGARPGSYQVTGRVEDGRGGAADCTVNLGVEEPPPPPQSSKLNECFFRAGTARNDNVCKRILDDVALRLQNDPRAKVVLVGYADPKEPRPTQLANSRAVQAKQYLVGKGIAEARVDVRAAGGQAGADRQNRRIDVIWVPEGATY